jgi:predicted lipoprotein with Yx(FWY)xxD motif
MQYHTRLGLGLRRAGALTGAGLLLTACGYEGAAISENTVTGHVPYVIITHDHPQLGTILTDSGGGTIYFTDQEADGITRCTRDCLKLWTPVTIPKMAPAYTGIEGLGTVNRSDNDQNQLTYEGKPLYTFILDSKAGDTNGLDADREYNGAHFVWHTVVIDETHPGHQGGFGL